MASKLPAIEIALSRDGSTVAIRGRHVWEAAEAILDLWAQTAIRAPVCKVAVTFADGQTERASRWSRPIAQER